MSKPPRVGAVHALAFSLPPTQAAFSALWPEAEVAHLTDGSLYLDRSKGTADEVEIARRIGRLLEHSESCGADVIIFTGSFFGRAVREQRTGIGVPVLASFEGVVASALDLDQPLCVMSTAADSTVYLADEIRAEAATRGQIADIESVVVEGAMEALGADDEEGHNGRILDAIAGIDDDRAVVMAQFTMERTLTAASELTSAPVIGPATEGVRLLRKTYES